MSPGRNSDSGNRKKATNCFASVSLIWLNVVVLLLHWLSAVQTFNWATAILVSKKVFLFIIATTIEWAYLPYILVLSFAFHMNKSIDLRLLFLIMQIRDQPLVGQLIPDSYLQLEKRILLERNNVPIEFPVIDQKRLLELVQESQLKLDENELPHAIHFLNESGKILSPVCFLALCNKSSAHVFLYLTQGCHNVELKCLSLGNASVIV